MNNCEIGDCREIMRRWVAEGVRVQMCVTSPPYWGLRDYGVPEQLGLESTPEEYVRNMVEVFRLVRELLAEDGTLWLNLGDSYAGSRTGEQGVTGQMADREVSKHRGNIATKIAPGCKPKDLVGIPWRVAFALRADGWYLRQDIIWSKPNPMPESVRDRCTKSHEYLFLLSKRASYYYDADAIAEPYAHEYRVGPLSIGKEYSAASGRNDGGEHRTGAGLGDATGTRNKRSVWTVTTQPYADAHFATFPPALIEPCILAGSRSGDVVLDPFMGSGTTGEVAQNLGRQWLGCELSAEYGKLQAKRTAQLGMVLA